MNIKKITPQSSIEILLAVMEQLRDKESGCEWDKQQDLSSLTPFVIEEAYEVVDAIRRKDDLDLKQELGDLLFQVVFLSEIAKEKGVFEFKDVVTSLSKKLKDRHPYVFKEPKKHSAKEQIVNWELIKNKERKAKELKSLMDNIPIALPALMRSKKIQQRASQVGFDWKKNEDYFKKIDEEIHELKGAVASNNKKNIEEEIGDIFMILVNFASKFDIDSESALNKGNLKFKKRFNFIEQELKKRNKSIYDSTIEEMDSLWNKSKDKN